MEDYLYIPIEKDLIPYRFEMVLNGRTYTFEIHYNAGHDFFTVDLYKNDRLVFAGEKILYGKPLFASQQYTEDAPDVPIIPYDLSQATERVTWDNLNEAVFLWIFPEAS